MLYKFDEIPHRLRGQVVYILDRAIGKRSPLNSDYSMGVTPEEVWRFIRDLIAEENGAFFLYHERAAPRDNVVAYITDPELNYTDTLDAIDISFRVASNQVESLGRYYKDKFGVTASSKEAIEQLNMRFLENDIGYQFVGEMIVRMDSQYTHSEIVEPTISLLQAHGFSGALAEFLSAHKHYRHGEIQDAITDANNAFESAMKTICQRQNIPLTGRERAAELIPKMTGLIIPPYLRTSLDALTNVMQALPTIRNRTPSAGHGQGATAQDVADHVGAYAIHLAASNILFLVEAWLALQKNNPS